MEEDENMSQNTVEKSEEKGKMSQKTVKMSQTRTFFMAACMGGGEWEYPKVMYYQTNPKKRFKEKHNNCDEKKMWHRLFTCLAFII
jgi:hypothetical protein